MQDPSIPALVGSLLFVAILAGCSGDSSAPSGTTDTNATTTPAGTNNTTTPPPTTTTPPPLDNDTADGNESCPPPPPPVTITDSGDLDGTFSQDYPWTLAPCAKTFTAMLLHQAAPGNPIRIGGIAFELTQNDTIVQDAAAALLGTSAAPTVLLDYTGNTSLVGAWNLHIDTGDGVVNQAIGCICHYEVEIRVAY